MITEREAWRHREGQREAVQTERHTVLDDNFDIVSMLWTLRGAEGDEGGDGGGDTDGGTGDAGGDGDEQAGDGLTDAGRKAIESERASAKRAKDAYKPWAAIRRDFNLTPEQVRERLSGKTETKDGESVDVEAVRREAVAEAETKANRRIVRSEIKALASESFVDPADASLFLDPDDFEVDDEGDVDADAIRAALKSVLKSKPHLARKTASSGDFDGGPRNTPPKPQGMSQFIRNASSAGRGR